MGDIDCIFGLDARSVVGFITCAQTGRPWFNANQPFKATTIKVAYTKRAMSRRWDRSQVHCMTHSSLWAYLGMIMMDGVADLSSGSVNSTSNTVVIKPGQIVATATQVDSVEMLPDSEPDNDKSIPSTESVFSCVKREDEFLYPCSVTDEVMDAEDKEFDLNMDII